MAGNASSMHVFGRPSGWRDRRGSWACGGLGRWEGVGGFVEPEAVEELVWPDVSLVSVMAANGETGVMNPVAETAGRPRAAGALMHCDGHERGLRSEPLNVAGIVGMGAAARIAADERERESVRLEMLRDRLVATDRVGSTWCASERRHGDAAAQHR